MKKNYGFIIELFIMLTGFILTIMVMSGIFARSLATSQKARHLNDAVIVASNGAEIFLAGKDEEGFADVFKVNDEKNDDSVTVSFNERLEADENGRMKMVLSYVEKDGMTYGHFDIYYDGELLYDLDVARYDGEEGR